MLRGAGVHAGSRRVAICAESSGCLRMLTVAQVAKEVADFEGMGAQAQGRAPRAPAREGERPQVF